MPLWLFLLLDALFLVGLTWMLWRGFHRQAPVRRTQPPAIEARPIPVRSVLFEGNSSRLPPEGVAQLDDLAAWLRANNARLELEGSADDTGHATQNRKLVRLRAAVVHRALLSHGIAPDRLVVRLAEPARGTTEPERRALRCVRVRVLS